MNSGVEFNVGEHLATTMASESNVRTQVCDDEHSLDEAFQMYGIGSTNLEDDCSLTSIGSDTLSERLNSRLFVVRVSSSSGKILSQFPIEESDAIAADLVKTSKIQVPCLSFRSMLQPILKDRVPARDELWLRRCFRGILVSTIDAKLTEDSSIRLTLGPELVYCWFMENQHSTQDIWSFYYGIKRLSAQRDAEACLHYQILDDDNLDYTSCLVDTLLLIRTLMGQSWNEQFSGCQRNIWMSLDVTTKVISDAFRTYPWTDPSVSMESVNRQVGDLVTESELSDETDRGVSPRADLFSFLWILMRAHADQIKKNATLLRVVFETASKDDKESVSSENLVSLTQLHEILKATVHVHEPVTFRETALLYRDAYELLVVKTTTGFAPRGINFDSFLFAAKRFGLFSRKRRGCVKYSLNTVATTEHTEATADGAKAAL